MKSSVEWESPLEKSINHRTHGVISKNVYRILEIISIVSWHSDGIKSIESVNNYCFPMYALLIARSLNLLFS